jgi:Glycosyl hydrolase catalytic core
MTSVRRLLGSLLLASAVLAAATQAGVANAASHPPHHTPKAKAKKKPRVYPVVPVVGVTQAKIGIADQKAATFDDLRFRALGLKYARRSVGYDVATNPSEAADLDLWLAKARLAGVEPLLTFGRSSVPAQRRVQPTVQQFTDAILRFKARWPAIPNLGTWNEANYCGQGACHNPALIAGYYKVLKRVFPRTHVVAADLVDLPNMIPWATDFVKAAGVQPKYWGLHNYITANRGQTKATKDFLRTFSGEVWMTEVGGLVARRNRSTIVLPQGPAHAAAATRFIFDTLARLSPRVTHIYAYQWHSTTASDTWDSAFIGPDDLPRLSLTVLQRVLRQQRAVVPTR